MNAVAVAETRVESIELVLPTHTNNHGTAFGGQICAWCDIAASVSAQRFCRSGVVTASMDRIDFRRPVRRGMIVVLEAQVNQAWRSSMEVGVAVWAENPETGIRTHCCTAFLTFVALDPQGAPCDVPKLDTSGDPLAQQRAVEAEGRRSARLGARVR